MSGSGKYILGALIALLVLNGCGGGSGGSGLTIKPKSQTINIQAEADTYSVATIDLSIDKYEAKVVYFSIETENYNLIDDVHVNLSSMTNGSLSIYFRAHSSIAPGDYNDDIKVKFCYDSGCNELVNGSPFIIEATYSVPNRFISTDQDSISIDVAEFEDEYIERKIPVSVTGIDANSLYIQQTQTGDAIQSSYLSEFESNSSDLNVSFKNPSYLDIGEYDSEIEIQACYDNECTYIVHGSPIKIPVKMKVTGPDTISLNSQKPLEHNIIDAEFNPVLNSIVMVSSEPSNAAYIYDTDSELSYKIELNKEPTAVTIANDSGAIAVGHDNSISIIEPNTLQLDKSTVLELEISGVVYDLVMNNNKVHFTPKYGQWTEVVTVNTNTKQESTSTGNSIYDSSKIKLSPSGNSLYLITTSLSPSDIDKLGISPDSVEYKYDSPYHGDYSMCNGIWLYQTGKIYTKCGNTFSTSDNKDDDIIFTGKLPLTEIDACPNTIEHLVEANASNEIMYVEDYENVDCGRYDSDAKQWLRLSDSDTLQNTGYYSFPKYNGYRLRGDYVFYNNNDKRFLISHTKEDGKRFFGEMIFTSK